MEVERGAARARTVDSAHQTPTSVRLDCGLEAARLIALDGYDILDTPKEEAFDRVTRLTKRIFDVPIVMVALLDGHRQWFKSAVGVAASETGRDWAFCNIPIAQNAPLVVPDALADPRFVDNPFVTGEPGIRFYAGAPLRSPQGHVLGTLCVVDRRPRSFDREQVESLCDLAQIIADELELRRLASTDALTGVSSRRAFCESAARTLRLAARYGHELSLVAIDFDHFKRVNDAHGHAVGDEVLVRSIAACLRQLRKTDVIGRLGGEEFAALLPHTGAGAALDVAERLRAAVAAETYGSPEGAFSVTASFGLTTSARGAVDVEALLAEADVALYRAKIEGRNRCVVARPQWTPQPATHRRVLKGGQILFDSRTRSCACTVRSLSDEGAGIDVMSSKGLPDTFELAIDADEEVRACTVLRKTERRIEVAFS
ncbi:sensor domain-containing diguanylate cyclase [Methylopila sp. M107]|uniref:GGDEF domain-containing protein n=1 Tax=Methylopila sp. M107 TaxID=1101190 RepID=UPI00035C8B2F|nr:sensor domain-containing diguanylate cyclase [Methylopila sp. M107]